jgi:nitrate/TMAO reductase-like tetraheme cytochrome c subunit
MRRILSFLPKLWANWITLSGTVITTVTALAIVVFGLVELFSSRHNPYGGMFAVFLPILFAAGLLLIPAGFWVERRKAPAARPDVIAAAFQMAVHDQRARRLILFVASLTVVNVILIASAGIRAANYMDTQEFCGTSCHTPMQPEWTAYQRSPHNKVECVQCHIGPGTGALVRAKLNGMSQLVGVITNRYSRPVPAPVAHMRSNEVTCEGCHSRSAFIGDRARLFPHYKDGKDNAPAFNLMVDHVGGLNARTRKFEGIHAHLDPSKKISFEYLDARRTKVGKITVVENGKLKAEYAVPGETAKPAGVRTMECIDCHNRATHRFDGTARQAVEKALWSGELDATQPYLAKVAAETLGAADVSHEDADGYFRTALAAAYAPLDAKPSAQAMDKAALTLSAVYKRNVFPKMHVTWNSYPDLANHYAEHDEVTGCFRCHDGKHVATLANGRTKKMDRSCDLCHAAIGSGITPEKLDETVKQMVGIPLD